SRVEERTADVARLERLADDEGHVARITVSPNADGEPASRPLEPGEQNVSADDRLSADQEDLVALRDARALCGRAWFDGLHGRVLCESEYPHAGSACVGGHLRGDGDTDETFRLRISVAKSSELCPKRLRLPRRLIELKP